MSKDTNNQEIQLKLTLPQVNLLLEGLGEMPFKKVFNLINEIQQQAAQQINPPTNGQANGKEEVKPAKQMSVHE